MTADEIAKLRELCANATPGPWGCGFSNRGRIMSSNEEICSVWSSEETHDANAAFIAAARKALPAALDEIERLSEALGVTLKELKRHSPVCHAEVLGWIVTDLGLDPDAGVSK